MKTSKVKKSAALWAVIGLILAAFAGFTIGASPAKASELLTQTLGFNSSSYSPAAVAAPQAALVPPGCIDRGYHQWAHLGGDPVRPNVETRVALRKEFRSKAGRTALRCNGLSKTEIAAIQASWQRFKPCPMTQGMRFDRMTFGSAGNKVDHPTVFVDPRFPNGAPAWCLTITVGGSTISLLIPVNCGNVALVSRKRKAPTAPKPGSEQRAPVTIVKIAEDAFSHVIPTPTNTFFFTVTTTGSVTTVRYDQDPQPAGTCIVGSIVLVAENPTPGWELYSPASNLQTFVCLKNKGVTVVFKNRQRPVTPPTTPTVTATTTVPTTSTITQTTSTTTTRTTTTTTTTTTTPTPKQHSCFITPIKGKDGMQWSASVGVDDSSGGPNGTIFWGDGESTPGLQGDHTYRLPNSYTISADVSFNDGQSAHCSANITAQPPPPPPPPPGG